MMKEQEHIKSDKQKEYPPSCFSGDIPGFIDKSDISSYSDENNKLGSVMKKDLPPSCE